jgi:homocitrate synthase NifV
VIQEATVLIDTTLREGEQAYGVYLALKDRERIALELAACGVEEVELGWVGQEELPALRAAVRGRMGRTAVSLWSPMREEDVRQAAALSPDRLNLGLPVSDQHIRLRLNLDRGKLLALITREVGRAVSLGIPSISVGLEDATRADPEFALTAARTALAAGARRIRIADTVGLASPLDMAELVRRFLDGGVPCLAVHCHNDFGMATANAVTALACGAEAADVSVLGLGERAGIAALEEVAASLVLRDKASRTYDLHRIGALCRFVAQAAGRPMAPDKSVTGRNIFACETGLHVHGLSESSALFEPFPAEAVGGRRVVGLGKKSGRRAVRIALDGLGLACPPEKLPEVVRGVRGASARLGRPLNREEVRGLTRRILSPKR